MCNRNDKTCKLAMVFRHGINVEKDFCKDRCGETPQAKLRMLKRLGVEFDADYDGSDLLEWVKAHGKRKGDDERKAEQEKRQAEAEAERQRLLSEMPHGFELAANLWRHLKDIHDHYKKTGRIKLEQADIERRLLICQDCPSKRSVIDDSGSLRCTDCGCHIKDGVPLLGLDGKAAYEAINCKRGHWPTIIR